MIRPKLRVEIEITSQVPIVMRIWRYVRLKWNRILIDVCVTTRQMIVQKRAIVAVIFGVRSE